MRLFVMHIPIFKLKSLNGWGTFKRESSLKKLKKAWKRYWRQRKINKQYHWSIRKLLPNCKPDAGLPLTIISKLKPIFHELGSKKCLHGLTQNQNGSFNSMIWDRKTKCASMVTLTLRVYDAVAKFNIDKKASITGWHGNTVPYFFSQNLQYEFVIYM